MDEIELRFASTDGVSLAAILATPSTEVVGGVVLAHGITVEKNEGGFYSRLAARLAEKGLVSLRFDFRAHGDSSGESYDMTIAGEVIDLTAAVEQLRDKGFERIAIVGTSFGAGVATLYSAKHEELISSLVLLSPVIDYRRTFLQPETEWGAEWFAQKALRKAERTGRLNLDGYILGQPLLEEFEKLNPIQSLQSSNIPTLIIHGTDDSMVPFAVAKQASNDSSHIRFVPIEDADHGFEGLEDKAFDEVVTWVLSHLG